MEYDLYKVVLVLEAAGADPALTNNAGSAAGMGIDGGKVRQMVMLQSGETTQEFLDAMTSFLALDEEARKRADKAELVQIRMKVSGMQPFLKFDVMVGWLSLFSSNLMISDGRELISVYPLMLLVIPEKERVRAVGVDGRSRREV